MERAGELLAPRREWVAVRGARNVLQPLKQIVKQGPDVSRNACSHLFGVRRACQADWRRTLVPRGFGRGRRGRRRFFIEMGAGVGMAFVGEPEEVQHVFVVRRRGGVIAHPEGALECE
jgi:hypothetical protein